jgi:hypothetical protein
MSMVRTHAYAKCRHVHGRHGPDGLHCMRAGFADDQAGSAKLSRPSSVCACAIRQRVAARQVLGAHHVAACALSCSAAPCLCSSMDAICAQLHAFAPPLSCACVLGPITFTLTTLCGAHILCVQEAADIQEVSDQLAGLSLSDDSSSARPGPFPSKDLAGVAHLLRSGKAQRVLVMVGAGISTAAGIPDFRTPGEPGAHCSCAGRAAAGLRSSVVLCLRIVQQLHACTADHQEWGLSSTQAY